MKKLTLLLSLFLPLSVYASADRAVTQLKSVLSEILEIQGPDDGKPAPQDYRRVLEKNWDTLKEVMQDSKLTDLIKEDPRLKALLLSADHQTVFNYLSGFVKAIAWMPFQNSILIKQMITQIPDAALESFDEGINFSIGLYRFSETTAITMLLDPSQGVDLQDVPVVLRKFLQMVLENYFDELDVRTKRAIVADVLRLKADAPSEEVLAVILNHCGPVLQKAFQLFSKDVHSEKLSKVLARLRQNIKAFPNEQAKAIIEAEAGISVNKEFLRFPDKPLAAATMGQVYLVKNKKQEKVIIKVQRPGVLKKAEAEFTLLRRLSTDASVLNFIDELAAGFDEEADFQQERANLLMGKVYDGKMKKKLTVIHEVPDYKSTGKVLFLNCAEGKSIEKHGDEANDIKKKALQEFLYVWVQEALFGSHVFHADLHPGNIFLDIDEDDNYLMTLIDFGSIGSFSQDEARALFKVLVGIAQNKPVLALAGFRSVASWKGGVDEEFLLNLIKEVLATDINPFYKAGHMFDKAIENGILLPKSIIQFYRGESFIEKQLMEIYQSEHGKEEGTKRAEEAITGIFRSAFKWNIFWDVCRNAVGADECDLILDSDVYSNLFW